MSARLRLSVVVCTYNDERRALLRATLAGVAAQRPPCDELIVVVDHNPALAAALRVENPDALVVESTGPKGLSGARNTGIATATGDVVVFLDDDAVPRTGWLAALTAPFADDAIAGVGGHAEPAWELGARPRWMPPELDWVVGCSFVGQPHGDVRNPIGCSMALRADVLARVGGFATELGRVGTLPSGCEETEIGLRINRAGGRIVLVEDSVVDHFVPFARSNPRYVLRRFHAEGISKAIVRELAKDDGTTALDPERRYVIVLARAMARAIVTAVRRRSLVDAAPAVLIPVAGVAAASGFVRGTRARSRR